MVDDGEITCSQGGIPYENGPVKCVKDCPDCKAQPSPAQAEQPTADDYEEVLADHRRLVREMDVLLNGEACAAKQAMLCDLVSQVEAGVRKSGQPLLVSAERYRWLRNDDNWGADDSEGQGTSKWANLGELSGTDFDAYLDQLRGSNPVMDIDPEHSKAMAKRGRDAIVAQAEGAPVIGCLCGMPMTEGRHSPGGCASLEEFAPNPAQAQVEQAEGAHVPDEVFAGVFSEWWEEEGQYCRAGGGDYERTFAFQAWRHLYPLLLQARAALAQPSPPPHPASELDFSRPLETENGDPVKWICADVIEYKSARVCVAKDTGLVYSSPYIGLKIRNVMPEQAEAERPEGPTEDELEAAGLGYPLHKEEAVKLWYSGFRSEVITVLEAWEAIGHDIGMNPDKGELLDSLRYMLEKCEAHDAALARVAELERQQPVAWMHDQPNRVDVIHRDVKDLLQRVPGSSRGIYRPLDVSEHYTIPLYAAPVAQAQHSVPEISGIGRDAEHPRAVVLYLRNEPSEEDMRAIQNFLRAISADVLTQAQHSAGYAEARQCVNCRHIGINDAADYAACHDCRWTGPEPDEDKCPGCAGENCMAAACPECGGRYELVAEAKISTPAAQAGQVPQAWLDVQAERRRQVEAEGWTPEHDDAHSHGQMARAAACYALAGSSAPNDGTAALLVSLAWPWDEQWWKPSTARRDMVKACALGLAEIERLDRVAASQGGPSDA
ncbi:hypothetical protein QYZ58_08220 [Pseudomonas aeruginosa]|nr:hypothetical protein [Pseudomonas aeruginosa]